MQLQDRVTSKGRTKYYTSKIKKLGRDNEWKRRASHRKT